MDESASIDLLAMSADLVSAYVSNNSVSSAELPTLLVKVHGGLTSLSAPPTAPKPEVEKATPAQIRKSIMPDALISFEDGKSYKTLRRHLTLRGLSPEAYRAKWGLPNDYPMTSASYSAVRSALAKELALGNQRRKVEAAPEPVAKPKRAGRPRKVAELA